MKTCTTCKETKELSLFYRNRTKADGLHGQCKDCMNKRGRKHYRENPKEYKEYREKHKERKREYDKKYKVGYRKNNKGKINAHTRKRQAAKRKRTPMWLADSHLRQMECVYKKAAQYKEEFDLDMHVDHIIPLQGKTVSGLHVPWNLRITTAEENLKKGSKYEIIED